ncbi:MAG TPA: hypothetical protein VKI44_02410 [Acetobacteraceae bacterium]|nr:hypothetical protein [Acetobacteraceae bacterium]
MHIGRKKAFRQLFRLIRAVEADHEDLVSVRELNLLALKEVLRAEQAILRHRETQRALKRQLKTGRGSREASAAIRVRLSRVASYIEAQEDQIFIWKCFGDALAYVYLDKFSIKHAFFETDDRGIKAAVGMLSGKDGLPQEITILFGAIDNGVPAVLCDITNTLRYGDVCLLGGSDPLLFEVKSNPKLNRRGKRQIAKLQKLHDFLETDSASNFRGLTGITKRVDLAVPERNHIDSLNDCIARANRDGQCVVQPEPGVTYVAIYGKPDLDAVLSKGVGDAPTVFILNSDKNEHAWAPYTPFVLSIRDEVHLLDFIEGRLFLIVLIDAEVLCGAMRSDEWAVRYRPDHEYPIQCLHHPTKAYFGVSGQFFARAAYEFASLAWIAKAHQPSLEHLKDMADNSFAPADPIAQRRALANLFGPDDEWAQ